MTAMTLHRTPIVIPRMMMIQTRRTDKYWPGVIRRQHVGVNDPPYRPVQAIWNSLKGDAAEYSQFVGREAERVVAAGRFDYEPSTGAR